MSQTIIHHDRKNREYEYRLPIMTEELRRGIDESDRLIRRLDEVRYELANETNLFAFVENFGPPGDKPRVGPGFNPLPGPNPFRPIPVDKFNAILEKARVLHWKIIDVDTANDNEAGRIWGLPAALPAAGPPGSEGRGMPHHMRRGEEWQAGVNRRRR
jgi:hypothetical protein